MNARQLIDEVSTYLVDQDPYAPFEHWSETDLLNYLRLAVALVASTQKDKFTQRVRTQLVAGAVQTMPPSCVEFQRVVGQVGLAGDLISYPRRAYGNDLHLQGKIGCRDCLIRADGEYEISSWSYDSADTSVFYVEPPVPNDVAVEVEIACFVPPTVDTLDSAIPLGLHYRPALFELMLYYAYGVDTESVPSRDRAAVHWNNALMLLGIEQKSISNRYSATRIPETRLGARK